MMISGKQRPSDLGLVHAAVRRCLFCFHSLWQMENIVFRFGENWASFSRLLSEERIQEAVQSLNSLFGEGALRGKSFLDIGCGSGLFSIAAARLGCHPVVGVDVDPLSVQVSRENAKRAGLGEAAVSFRQASVLDPEQMVALGTYDVVYAWGVLHHTGAMYDALRAAAQRVRPGGWLMVAVYNRHWSSAAWKVVKRLYNRVGKFGQSVLIWAFVPLLLAAKWLVTFKNPFKVRRGMDFMHNVVDWLGGYPYEYAGVEEMTRFLETLNLRVVEVRRANTPTGCNEFICRSSRSGE